MSFGFGFGFTKITAAIRAAFSPSSLFAANEPGVWYDPSDLSTMFQDAAGTTPVTAVEQPVGLMLDKSGNGNHASQTTATSRPVLSARYNVVQKSDQPANSYWLKVASTGVENAVYETNVTGSHGIRRQNPGLQAPAGTLTTLSAKVKANGRNYCILYDIQGRYFDITPGTSGAVLGGYDANVPQASIKPLGDDWFLCQITYPCPSIWHPQIYASDTGTRASYAGDVTKGIYVTDIDLRPANQAHLPYQRVNTATDYDTTGFPHYLRFDGVDDWLVTNTITPGTDKVQLFAGVRKLNDTPGLIYGHGPNTNVTAGSFEVLSTGWTETASRYGAALNISLLSRADSPTDFAPPRSDVLNWAFNTSGSTLSDEIKLRVNGTLQTLSISGPTQSGNFTTQIGYIGRRNGTTTPFNGHIYSLIVRFGSNLPAATIEKTEKYINTKTRAY